LSENITLKIKNTAVIPKHLFFPIYVRQFTRHEMSSAPPGESLNPQNTLQQAFFSDQLQLHVPDSDSDTDTDISDISNNLPSNSDCDSMFDLEEIAPSQTTISQVLSIRVAAPRPPVATKKRQPHNII
jgi:hypothetical protein